MNKIESGILKGIGIVMMLFHHLFVLPKDTCLIDSLIMIGDVPAVHKLALIMSPVYIFLIISGYGYYKKFLTGDKPRITNLISLYLKYWIILGCFIMLGLFIGKYDATIMDTRNLIGNLVGYNTSINREVWFLLPFVCLCMGVKWLLRMYNRYMWIFLALSASIWFFSSYLLSYYYQSIIMVFLLRILYFIFPFLIGATLAKTRFFERVKNVNEAVRIVMPVMIILLFYIRIMFNGFPQLLFCMLLSIFVILSVRPIWLDSVLFFLGKKSTSLWFIHTFICYYLFHDYIYALKYPLLIFLGLISFSLILTYLFDYLHLICWRKLRDIYYCRYLKNSKQIL